IRDATVTGVQTCALPISGEALDRGAHRLRQVTTVEAVNEVRDDFGIGLAVEAITLRLKLGAQGVVIFDDAVVYQRDFADGHQRRSEERRVGKEGTVRWRE